jgi:hypothetical protein
MHERPLLSALLMTLVACAPSPSAATGAPSPVTPSATVTPRTSTPETTATETATTQPRIAVSDGPLTSSSGAYLFFQLPNDPRFRAISFDAAASGIVPLQVAPNAIWSQSPGTPLVIGTTAYTREGVTLGTVPWPAGQFTWSSDGRFMCAAGSQNRRTGEPLRLETAFIGQTPKLIASGFGVYSDNAGFPVLACDEGRDRVIVAALGQGVAPGRLWIFRLSTGMLIRAVDYSPRIASIRWVAAAADGSLIAEAEQLGTAAAWRSTILSTDDGAPLATLDGIVQGFSGDNTLAVVSSLGSATVVDWKTGRRIWNAIDVYGGFLTEPAGKRLVVGTGMVGGSDKADVYLVQPDGTAFLLPARVRVMLRY